MMNDAAKATEAIIRPTERGSTPQSCAIGNSVEKSDKQNYNMEDYNGKKVLVRSYDAGVYFGTLEWMNGEQVKLTNVRNIWHWTGASCLSQIANEGIKGDKVSPVVGSMVLNRVCQVIPLTKAAINNLENQPTWTY